MAGYNEIRGLRVKYLSADPSNAEDGQVWYNSTSGNLRVQGIGVGAWSSSSSMVNGRPQCSGTGTQTAGLAAGTYPPAVGSYGGANQTEEYNGSGWSIGGDMSNGKADLNTFGTQTAAYAAGGDAHPTNPRGSTQVESYNGTSWTSAPALPQGSYEGGGSASNGTATSALVLGGRSGPPSAITNVTQTWNGSSWGTGGTYPSTIQGSFVFGESTPTMISAGGYNGTAVQGNAFSYDGSNWTAINSMQDGRYVGVGSGTNTSGLLYGGASGSPDTRRQTETFDGTIFSVGALMASPRNSMAGSKIGGTTAFAASTPGVTEEYNFTANTVTAGAWSSGGALGTARDQGGAAANAVSDAALYFGGYNGSALGITEEYNGSSWSEQNDLGTARSGRLGGAGTQTAGLCFGGNPGGALNEEYDGTSWTERGDLNTPRNQLCGVGISTAALAYGGQTTPSGLNNTEEYDGSSWTAQNTLNTARYGFSGAGLQTSALAFCGVQSPPTISNDTEEYNGTSWTSVNDMIQPAFNHGGSGAQTAALLFGGQTGTSTGGAKTSAAFGYDGTNWSTRPSMGTTRSQISGSSGTSNISAAAFGGTIPPYSTATEEFTSATSVAGPASNITTS